MLNPITRNVNIERHHDGLRLSSRVRSGVRGRRNLSWQRKIVAGASPSPVSRLCTANTLSVLIYFVTLSVAQAVLTQRVLIPALILADFRDRLLDISLGLRLQYEATNGKIYHTGRVTA
jgi:hypothetical protein